MTGAVPWRFSLLSDPMITVRGTNRRNQRRLTLPELLSELPGEERVADFPRVAAHQRHPLHAFLVQLATIALHRAGLSGPSQTAEVWRELLLALTQGAEEPYALVVEDLSTPALLQPPVPERTLEKWKVVETPDALDILVTAKNHDVKGSRVSHGDPETWFLALLSLQTMQGFLGAGNYGIARMNGGFASRPDVGLSPSLYAGPRFVRDVEILLCERPKTAETYGYSRSDGHALLWLQPWDGTTSVDLDECDPYFIEVCRRVRLVRREGGLGCLTTSSKCVRVAAKARNGVLGDPWTPFERDGDSAKALTVPADGFTYQRTQELLCGSRYEQTAVQKPRPSDPLDLMFTARVLVRGQGKTEGIHERVLPIPRPVRRLLSDPEQKSRLSQVAKAWVELAATMRNRALRPALLTLIQGAPAKLNLKDRRADADLSRFEAAVDQRFFDSLFAAIDRAGDDLDPLDDPHSTWGAELVLIGKAILEGAISRLPIPDARHYRAIVAAENVFYGAAKNQGFFVGRAKPTEQSNEQSQTEAATHD